MIREDPNKRGLLYAGTETGLYVSFDDGNNWQSMQFNLPLVPITDLAIHKREAELVAATQGRAFWIFDDLPTIHQMMDAGGLNVSIGHETLQAEGSLPDGWRWRRSFAADDHAGQEPGEWRGGLLLAQRRNRQLIWCWSFLMRVASRSINSRPDCRGPVLRDQHPVSNRRREVEKRAALAAARPARATTDVGLNRFVWDLRYPGATRFPGMILWAGQTDGPEISPGHYQVRLTVDGQTLSQEFEVRPDPRLTTSAADYAKQLDLALKVRDKLTETHNAIIQIRDVKKQVDDLVKRSGPQSKPITDAGNALTKKLTEVEEALYQTKNQSSQDPLNFPIRLNNKLAALLGVVSRSETPPNEQSIVVYNELSGLIDAQLKSWPES